MQMQTLNDGICQGVRFDVMLSPVCEDEGEYAGHENLRIRFRCCVRAGFMCSSRFMYLVAEMLG